MKIIFLDVDGVLNWHDFLIKSQSCFVVDPACVRRVNVIAARTGAQICISSTWRLFFDETQKILKSAGLNVPIVGRTADLPDHGRGVEIREWMNPSELSLGSGARKPSEPFEIESFVIIDDCDFGGELTKRHLVRTSMKDGLQDHHVDLAVEILNSRRVG
jgi:hypothetical protein